MKYIIMCGGHYGWKKQLVEIEGEILVARTIRQLREHGITDIAISSNDSDFEQFGVPVLHHDNPFIGNRCGKGREFYWVDAFYPMEEPVCYLFGDVVYTDNALDVIINKKTNDVEFFASAPPFAPEYDRKWAEPFAFKVVDTKHFRASINETKILQDHDNFRRIAIAWELWQVIKDTTLNVIDYTNYTVINDKTCDIDSPADVEGWNRMDGEVIIHTCKQRLSYVKGYLIPSLNKQGINSITTAVDTQERGCLEMCMRIFEWLPKEGSAWHLQDDVIISRDFAKRIREYNADIVCGMATKYDRGRKDRIGRVGPYDMWYSFPCIKIPNHIAIECAAWYRREMENNPVYRHLTKSKKHDDEMFRMFIENFYADNNHLSIVNASPNLVDHVDWLIGGSTVNPHRDGTVRALYFEDTDLVDKLEKELNNGKMDN